MKRGKCKRKREKKNKNKNKNTKNKSVASGLCTKAQNRRLSTQNYTNEKEKRKPNNKTHKRRESNLLPVVSVHTSIIHASCSTSFSPGNKGYPVYSSARIHPKLHMSMAMLYGIPEARNSNLTCTRIFYYKIQTPYKLTLAPVDNFLLFTKPYKITVTTTSLNHPTLLKYKQVIWF